MSLAKRRQASRQCLHGLADLIKGERVAGIILADGVDAYCQLIDFLGDVALFIGGQGDLLGPLGNVIEAGHGARQRRRRAFPRRDLLGDYLQAGKESYFIVSSFDQFEYREEAPLFRRLSDSFELCVYGLNLVKQDLARMQHQAYLRAQQLLSS